MIQYFNPLQWGKWLGRFVVLWTNSIPWGYLGEGIPALLLMVGFSFSAYFAYTGAGSWRKERVRSQVGKAIRTEEFETAELLLRRQMLEGDRSVETLFRFATIQNELGNQDESKRLMRSLVANQRGDEAAMWLVQELYLGKKWKDLDSDERAEFGGLLALLTQERPKDFGFKQLYADYLIASDRFAAAIPHLRELSQAQPMRGLQAAALARRDGDSDFANRLADQTLKRVGEMFKEEPANPTLALAVVQNQIFLGRHAAAVRTLSESIPRMKTEEHRRALQQAMGDTIAAWVSLIEQQKNETPIERLRVLKMLQVALQYAPSNPRVLTLVADQVLKTVDNQDDEVQSLRDALVGGTSPGIAHFVRGTVALLQDDAELAERHLTLATKHLPNSSAILNNLAVALSQKDDANLEKALALSEKAISTIPKPGPYFFETRGQILFRMKRYLDAIPDLERALRTDALAKGAHESLAICYTKLGQPDMARDHKDAAERMQ